VRLGAGRVRRGRKRPGRDSSFEERVWDGLCEAG
jgi:hypothetical protein